MYLFSPLTSSGKVRVSSYNPIALDPTQLPAYRERKRKIIHFNSNPNQDQKAAMSPRLPPTAPLPYRLPAWFTYPHNEYLERLLDLPPGRVLRLYQMHLVEAAQRILDENSEVKLFADEAEASPRLGGIESEASLSDADAGEKSASTTKIASGLRRRGAIRIPERSALDARAGERSASGTKVASGLKRSGAIRIPDRSALGARVSKRKPAAAAAADGGGRVARGRVGDARDGDGNVSSRTRTSSRRTSGGRRGS